MAEPSGRDLNRTARIIAGATAAAESPRARAARSRLEPEQFAIEVVDAGHWRIEGHSFWPELAMWRHPDGKLGGDGLVGLIVALRAAKKPPLG